MRKKISEFFTLIVMLSNLGMFGLFAYVSWVRCRGSFAQWINPFGYFSDIASFLSMPLGWFFIGCSVASFGLAMLFDDSPNDEKVPAKKCLAMAISGGLVALVAIVIVGQNSGSPKQMDTVADVGLAPKKFSVVTAAIFEIENGLQEKTAEKIADTSIDRAKFQKALSEAGVTSPDVVGKIYWQYVEPVHNFRRALWESVLESVNSGQVVESDSLKFLQVNLKGKGLLAAGELNNYQALIQAAVSKTPVPQVGVLNAAHIKAQLDYLTMIEVYVGKVMFGDWFNPREIRQYCPVDCAPFEISKAKPNKVHQEVSSLIFIDALYDPYDSEAQARLTRETSSNKETKAFAFSLLSRSKFRAYFWRDALNAYLHKKALIGKDTNSSAKELIAKGLLSQAQLELAVNLIKASSNRTVAFPKSDEQFVPTEAFLRDSMGQAIMDQVVLERALGIKNRKTASQE